MSTIRRSRDKSTVRTKGFTLIELLVVIAIIGVLAAIGVPAYNGYTLNAKFNASADSLQTAVGFITAEISKCNSQSTSLTYTATKVASPAALTCPVASAAAAQAFFTAYLQDRFGNSYTPSQAPATFVSATAPTTAKADWGKMSVTVNGNAVRISMSPGTNDTSATVGQAIVIRDISIAD
jgi:type IV pilus assembly protein PilA